jgi:hypothetical protein
LDQSVACAAETAQAATSADAHTVVKILFITSPPVRFSLDEILPQY